MLDKKIINCSVLGNQKFEIKVSAPFCNLATNFLADFSNKLRKFKKINLYTDLIYLIFWCGKNNKMEKNINMRYLRLVKNLEESTKRSALFYYVFSSVVTTGSILVPSLIAIQDKTAIANFYRKNGVWYSTKKLIGD